MGAIPGQAYAPDLVNRAGFDQNLVTGRQEESRQRFVLRKFRVISRHDNGEAMRNPPAFVVTLHFAPQSFYL